MSNVAKLKDLLVIKNGSDYRNYNTGDVPVYGSSGIMTYIDKGIYNGESILLPRKGTLNNIMYVNGNFWTVDTMYWSIINKSKSYPKYLFCYLSLLDLSCKDSGSTLPSMTFDSYYDLPIFLPSYETQKKIGDFYFSITNKIENNNKIISELESMAKTIYDYWFLQFDFPDENGKPYKSSGGRMVWNEELKREIPEGWKNGTFEDLIEINNGKDHQCLDNGDIPVYGSGGEIRRVSDYLYDGEAILIPRKGSLNNVFYVENKFWTVDTIFYSIPKIKQSTFYTLYSIKLYNLETLNTGTGVPSMTMDIIYNLKVVIPNNDTLKDFYKIEKQFFSYIYFLQKENEELSSLRDFLLPMLMNGQVTFKDSK